MKKKCDMVLLTLVVLVLLLQDTVKAEDGTAKLNDSSTLDIFKKSLSEFIRYNGGLESLGRTAAYDNYQTLSSKGLFETLGGIFKQYQNIQGLNQNYFKQGQGSYQQNNIENGYGNQYGYYPQNGQAGYPHGGFPRPVYPSPQGYEQGFLEALTSITRYDDLRCVPRLLCEVASAGKAAPAAQSSIIPFASRDSLVSLLTVLNFVDDSPLMIFGRAALLGYATRGDTRGCIQAYPTCPRDPSRLVDYLNNHNGGFFRFFQGAPGQQIQGTYPQSQGPQGQYPPHHYGLQHPQNFGQYSPNYYGQNAQNNYGQYAPHYYGQNSQQNIDQYYPQYYNHYPQNYAHSPQAHTYSPPQSAYGYGYTQNFDQYSPQYNQYRILTKPGLHPESFSTLSSSTDQGSLHHHSIFPEISHHQSIFPGTSNQQPIFHDPSYQQSIFPQSSNHNSIFPSNTNRGSRLSFPKDPPKFTVAKPLISNNLYNQEDHRHYAHSPPRDDHNHRVPAQFFPDRTGTGDLLLDYEQLYSHQPPSPIFYQEQNTRDPKHISFPQRNPTNYNHKMVFPKA